MQNESSGKKSRKSWLLGSSSAASYQLFILYRNSRSVWGMPREAHRLPRCSKFVCSHLWLSGGLGWSEDRHRANAQRSIAQVLEIPDRLNDIPNSEV